MDGEPETRSKGDGERLKEIRRNRGKQTFDLRPNRVRNGTTATQKNVGLRTNRRFDVKL